MPTKAQAFRMNEQHAAHAGKPKKTAKRKRAHEGRRVSRFNDESMDRNDNNKAEQRGGVKLESSANGGKVSRKSTRGSSDHTKTATNLQHKATMKQVAPSTRTNARRH
jgi:hypothetical protein